MSLGSDVTSRVTQHSVARSAEKFKEQCRSPVDVHTHTLSFIADHGASRGTGRIKVDRPDASLNEKDRWEWTRL